MAETKVIVVTGASGFVGKRLVRRLSDIGHQVVPVSRKLGMDICIRKTLLDIGPFDHMIHLAARTYVPDSYAQIEQFFATNVTGTLNCLELCRNASASMSFASSYVYGVPEYLPVDELHPVTPWNPYAATKIMAEDLCKMYSQHLHVATSIFRIFNIYGPGQSGEFLVPIIVEGIKQGRVVLNTSAPKRDFVFVDDVIDAFLLPLALEESGSMIFNVGSGESFSVDEIVRLAIGQSGTPVGDVAIDYLEQDRKADIMDVVADISKLAEIGWTPKTSLKQGLEKCFG